MIIREYSKPYSKTMRDGLYGKKVTDKKMLFKCTSALYIEDLTRVVILLFLYEIYETSL